MEESTNPNSPAAEATAVDSVTEKLSSLTIPQPDDTVSVEAEIEIEIEMEGDDDDDDQVTQKEETEINSNSNNNNNNEEEEDSKEIKIRYPIREEAEECGYYMKTGLCKFGIYCKFNHPQGVKVNGEENFTSAPENVKEKGDYMVNQRRVYCKYFDRPGGCKYGKDCKFTHSQKASPASEFNFMGLPIRQGEKECPYYIRNGSCKFGPSCRFNHPDPTSGGLGAVPSHSNKGSMSSPSASQSISKSRSPVALNENPAYAPLMYPPTQGLLPRPEWTPYQAPAYYQPGGVRMAAPYAVNMQPSERNVNPHQQEQILGDEFPERPGEPECSYFLKTGNCKYKSACKFHHPKDASGVSLPYSLSELGLPLRPGESTCSFYSRYGICKYGPVCKYDHPVNHAHSAVDMSPGTGNNHAMAAGS